MNLNLRDFWRDKNGNLDIWKWPNLALWFWIGSTILGKLTSEGTAKFVFQQLALVSLVTWAWLEIVECTSSFRRVLGAAVLAIILASSLNV
jgi:hypothetical protein